MLTVASWPNPRCLSARCGRTCSVSSRVTGPPIAGRAALLVAVATAVAWPKDIVAAAAPGPPPATSQPASQARATAPARSATNLRLASSPDGIRFADNGGVFREDAVEPTLATLRDGRVVAIFVDRLADDAASPLRVSMSKDNGRTWTPAQPIRLLGAGARRLRPQHADLVASPDGALRLLLVCPAGPARGSNAGPTSWAFAVAASRDGISYVVDAPPREIPGGEVRPVGVWLERRLVVYLQSVGDAADTEKPAATAMLVSTDGRQFSPAQPPRDAVTAVFDELAPYPRGVRGYFSDNGAIVSASSSDGLRWTRDGGSGLSPGADPAVTPLADRTFLMIYAVAAIAPRGSAPALAGVAPRPGKRLDSARRGDAPPAGAAGAASDGAAGATAGGPGDAAIASGGAAPDADGQLPPGAADGTDPLRAPSGDPGADAPTPSAGPDKDGEPADDDGIVAPMPNFEHPVDYAEWTRQHQPDPSVYDAFDAYAEFMAMPGDVPGTKREWPDTINDMFNSDYSGPIGPWDAQSHPEWEATRNDIQWLTDAFRNATAYDTYTFDFSFTPEQIAAAPDGKPMLVEMLLPSLAQHRAMVKATMSNAWRAENGVVPPEQMLDALTTTFRAAGHMEQGPTLIHQLVGIAEQSLAESNARLALQQGVFSGEQLQTALDTLRANDYYNNDTSRWLPMESAWALEAFQRVFTPSGPNGEVQFNRDLAARIGQMITGDDSPDQINAWIDANMSDLTPENARAAAEVVRNHSRDLNEMWRQGYPTVRSGDIERMSMQYAESNKLAGMVIPSLGRAEHIVARNEASRRATQLAFALHLYKSRTGQWPQTLADLPAEYGDTMRVDPFTGGYFGYQLTESGPRVYTYSENGQDDGGIHSPNWDSDSGENGSDDYVFWPPQDR